MLSLLPQRKHRHTRPAKYFSRSIRAEQLQASRMDSNGHLSLAGMLFGSGRKGAAYNTGRRRYAMPNAGYNAGPLYMDRTGPVACSKGLRRGVAWVMLAVLTVVLGSALLGMRIQCAEASNAISERQQQYAALRGECDTLKMDIANMEGGINIRYLAEQMGMVSCRGKTVTYLESPKDAIITLADAQSILFLASIWGQ